MRKTVTTVTREPLWSILVPTVPNRHEAFRRVWGILECEIANACAEGSVEILSFCDNKMRSVGYKRQALLDIARGRYASFVDDDDEPLSGYVLHVLSEIIYDPEPDLICFPIKVTIDGEMEGVVRSSIAYVPKHPDDPLEEYAPPETLRPPHMLSVWKTEIARRGKFPDESFRDDFKWAAQCWPYVKREAQIPRTLYHWKGRSNEEATVGM